MRWGTGSARRLRGNSRKALLLGLAVALVGAGVAVAAGGLVNASFENGLSGWTARTIVYTSPTTRAIAYEGAEPVPPTSATVLPAGASRSTPCSTGSAPS